MSEGEQGEIELVLANDVATFLDEQAESPRVLRRIERHILALRTFPEMGQVYSPAYEGAWPPIPCRWIAVPSTPFTIYYHFFEETRQVVVMYVEHQRTDPQNRFAHTR